MEFYSNRQIPTQQFNIKCYNIIKEMMYNDGKLLYNISTNDKVFMHNK